MSNALILRYKEPTQDIDSNQTIDQGTKTCTEVAKESGDADAFLITLGTSTVTGVPKEANDADPKAQGVSFVPRKMNPCLKGLWY